LQLHQFIANNRKYIFIFFRLIKATPVNLLNAGSTAYSSPNKNRENTMTVACAAHSDAG